MSTRCLMASFIPFTMVMVLLSPPCLKTGTYTERCPSMRTMLYCRAPESMALPMSPTSTDELPTDLSGISFIDFASGNWLRRGVHAQHHWRQRPRRQAAQVGHRQVGDVAQGCVWISAWLEIDLDEA